MSAIMTVLLIASMLLGIPIAISMGIADVGAFALTGSQVPYLTLIATRMVTIIDSYVFVAIPLFIGAGILMDVGGTSVRLVDLARVMLRHIRGGLGMVVVVGEMFFSGISGSTVADVSAIGALLIPSMRRAGYRNEYAVSIVSAASAMGILIPPCIPMVILGGLANVSVAALFIGGFIPAFVLAAVLMVQLWFQARFYDFPREPRASFREFSRAVLRALIPLGMPVIIFGGILGGVASPTESAGVAVLYALIIGTLIYRELSLKTIWKAMVETGVTTGQVAYLVGFAATLSYIIAVDRVPEAIASFLQANFASPVLFLTVSMIIVILISSVLEPIPAMLVMVPVLMPIALKLGVDPIHFSILFIAAIGIGLFFPPVGVGLLLCCGIAKADVARTTRPMVPFIAMLVVGLVILILVPWFTTVLPNALLAR